MPDIHREPRTEGGKSPPGNVRYLPAVGSPSHFSSAVTRQQGALASPCPCHTFHMHFPALHSDLPPPFFFSSQGHLESEKPELFRLLTSLEVAAAATKCVFRPTSLRLRV